MLEEISLSRFIVESGSVNKELIAYCFNEQTTLNENTKIVIVGTLTPPDTSYFYCSYLNRIYGYIDEAIKIVDNQYKKSLKELKVGLSYYKSKNKEIKLLEPNEINKRVKEIKAILTQYNIAFLDVMDRAIRKKKTSKDSDIKYYVLAKGKFDEINESALIIPNSKTAEECLRKIINREYTFLSQRFDSKEKWVKVLSDRLKK